MIKLLPDSCYSQRPLPRVDCIVLHSLSAINIPTAKNKYGMQACYDLLARYSVSTHYLIGRNQGEAWQLVPYNLIAWHAGQSSWQGRQNVNNFSLGVELIGSQALSNYTNWQYEELARWLVKLCEYHYLTWNEITTHKAISPGRKTDPWGLDMNRLRHYFHTLMAGQPIPGQTTTQATTTQSPIRQTTTRAPAQQTTTRPPTTTTAPPTTTSAPEPEPTPTHSEDGILFSDGFDFPVGPRGSNINVFDTHKVDATLVDPEYQKQFNAWHPGEDWNGRGGGDTDLGQPVYAISNGRVVEAGYYVPSWGNIVLIEHVLSSGTRVWSQYAHLDQITVGSVGTIVRRGEKVGTIGKGEKTTQKPQGRWIAHLHFEIRRNKLPVSAWNPYVSDRAKVLANYHEPTSFINEHRPHLMDFIADAGRRPEVLVDAPTADKASGTFRKANVEHWYAAPYGYRGNMLWTFAATSTEANWAEWRPNLPEEGQWEVWAYIPERNATSRQARYRINHADGTTEAFIDQSKYAKQWVRLGKYRFVPGSGMIRLSDLTGERKRGIQVGFDAIRWVKIGS